MPAAGESISGRSRPRAGAPTTCRQNPLSRADGGVGVDVADSGRSQQYQKRKMIRVWAATPRSSYHREAYTGAR